MSTINFTKILEPVSRRTLSQEVVAILKRFILVENLYEGDRLPPERKLATSMGVSHRVVREALSVLNGEGIIVKEQGRGVFIRDFDREILHTDREAVFGSAIQSSRTQGLCQPSDFYELRLAIEVGAIGISARCATEKDLKKLQAIVDRMKPRTESGESLSGDEIEFHLTLLRASHNPVFLQLEDALLECIRFKMYADPDRLTKSLRNPKTLEEHQNIVNALRAGDGKSAVSQMYEHLTRDMERLLKLHE